nr:hypothetical protein [Tanacetum cinerariifolium]
WNSSDDEDVDEQTKGRDKSEGDKTDESNDNDDDQDEAKKGNDDDDDEEEISKIGEQKATESDQGDDEATESYRESLRIGEEERMHEVEEADELYRDININQERGLQVSQETADSHVILTPTQSDAQQESSSTSSFMTNLLNPLIDTGMESIFTTGSTTVTPIPSPQSTMTPSIISTFTTASQLPTPPPQILSLDLQSLPNFAGDVRKTMIRNDPPLDQTGGLRDEEKEGSMHQPALHLNQLPGVQTTCQMEEPSHPVFETGAEYQPIVQTSQHPEWFSQPKGPPTPDRNWNKTLPAAQGNAHLTELEYHLEEVYKAITDQLDWDNPEGQQYPYNLLQPLPLIPDNQGRRPGTQLSRVDQVNSVNTELTRCVT